MSHEILGLVLLGLLFVKLVVQREPVTPSFVARVVDHVIAMVAPPVRPTPATRARRKPVTAAAKKSSRAR